MGKEASSLVVLTVAAVWFVASPAKSLAQVYVDAQAGVSLPQKIEVRNAAGLPAPGVKLDLDPGFRADFAVGYNVNSSLGLELQSGFIHNEFKRVVGGASSLNISEAGLSHVPLMGNVVLRYDEADTPFVGYAGGGAGADYSILWDDSTDETDGEFAFAWQAFGGMRYKLTPSISVGVGYRFYSVNNTSFNFGGSNLDLGRANIHSVLLDFNFKF
jgi:opacity protein-like surface antigen